MLRFARLFLLVFFALPIVAGAQDAGKGEEIFEKKCKTCHRLTDEGKTGPGLADVTKRRTVEWLNKWLSNPGAVIASGDPGALALVKKYKVKMPTIDLMQDEKNRNDVIAFLLTLEVK